MSHSAPAAWHCGALSEPRGTGVPAVGKALAVGVREKEIKAGVEEGTQVWTETCPEACIGLLSTEVHIQDLGKALREAWRKEDGENLGLHYWATYLDWGWVRQGTQPSCWVLCCISHLLCGHELTKEPGDGWEWTSLSCCKAWEDLEKFDPATALMP